MLLSHYDNCRSAGALISATLDTQEKIVSQVALPPSTNPTVTASNHTENVAELAVVVVEECESLGR